MRGPVCEGVEHVTWRPNALGCRWHGGKWTRHIAVAAVLVVLLVGCAEDSGKVTAHGSVTYRGEPLTNAALSFMPIKGRPVTAPLNESGHYSIEVLPGDYTVTVIVGQEVPPGYREGDPPPPPRLELPPKYTIPVRSELSASVTEDSGPIDFALE